MICPPDSPIAKQAVSAGATLVGEETILDAVKEGRIDFDRCICHKDSAKKLQQAGVGRILGPRGLMPSEKLGTITNNVGQLVRTMVGATEYKETLGVIRCAVGQLGYTPEQLQKNIREFMSSLRKDIAALSDQVDKSIHEVVSGFSRVFSCFHVSTLTHKSGLELDKLARLLLERGLQKRGERLDKGPVCNIAVIVEIWRYKCI